MESMRELHLLTFIKNVCIKKDKIEIIPSEKRK